MQPTSIFTYFFLLQFDFQIPIFSIHSALQPDDIPIGFHMKLGHNITIATNREVQLENYSEVSHNMRCEAIVLDL